MSIWIIRSWPSWWMETLKKSLFRKPPSLGVHRPTSWSLIISLIQLVLHGSWSFKPRTLMVVFTHVVGVMMGLLTVASVLWGWSILISLGPLGAFQRLGCCVPLNTFFPLKFPPLLITSLTLGPATTDTDEKRSMLAGPNVFQLCFECVLSLVHFRRQI